MTTKTSSGLICLGPEDYAAIALAEQESAAAADAALTAINLGLTSYNNSPWAVAVTTVAGTTTNALDNFVPFQPPPVGLAVHFLAHSTTASGLSGLPTMTVPPAGWYHAGATCTFQATGAVNVNTRRDLVLTWSYAINGVNQYDQQSANSVFESNTAGDANSVTGLFYADGLRNYTLAVTFSHKNTSSSMQVNLGARYWVTYLGTGVVV